MAVFRVERNTGYTVMSNHHLRNKELSLKAKGLLSQMLSLPEDWDYFNVHISKDNLTADLEKVKTEEEAKRIAAACEKKQAVVSSLKRETKTVNPPKLYDLTTLQREANRYYGFTAQQTLDLVQTLYEKKLLTYPRTDSQFITDDMEDTARQVISIVCCQLPLFSGVSVTPDIARVTDNSKVTDHHAILPTVQLEKQDVSCLLYTSDAADEL